MREACMTRLSHMYGSTSCQVFHKMRCLMVTSQNKMATCECIFMYHENEYIVTCSWKCNSRVSYPECNWKVFGLAYTNYCHILEVGSSYSPLTCLFAMTRWPLKERERKKVGGMGKVTPSHFCYPKSKMVKNCKLKRNF
jgi:hypothetical protein